jgi:hypothetical protein
MAEWPPSRAIALRAIRRISSLMKAVSVKDKLDRPGADILDKSP